MTQSGWRGEAPRGTGPVDGNATRPAVGRADVSAPVMPFEPGRVSMPTPPMPFGPPAPLGSPPTPPPVPRPPAQLPVPPPPAPAYLAYPGGPSRGGPPGGGLPGRPLGPSFRRLLGANSPARLRAVEEDLRRVAQPVTTCRRIVVRGVCNGAGVTTLAALLGLVFATHRRDLTLAVDASVGSGSLASRLGDMPVWSYQDVASLAGEPDSSRVGQMVRSRGRLSVLPHSAGFSVDGSWTASTVLTRFCAVSIVDGGLAGPTGVGSLADANAGCHATVLAVLATMDGVRAALAWFARTPPQLRSRVMPVLVGDVSAGGLRRAATLRALSSEVPAACLPYDRGLAVAAVPVSARRLRQQTVDAVLHVAGAALTLACGGTVTR